MIAHNRQLYFGLIGLILIAVFSILFFQPTTINSSGLEISTAVSKKTPLPTGTLTFDGISSTQATGGWSDILTPMSMTIPTREPVMSIELLLDGKSYQKGTVSDFGEVLPVQNESQQIILVGYLNTLAWMGEGKHVLTGIVKTTNQTFQRKISVTVDLTSPTANKQGEEITFTDASGIDGISIHLLDREGIENPVVLQRHEKGSTRMINLDETTSHVNTRWFRLITVTDRAGNIVIVTPDRSETPDEVMDAYRRTVFERLSTNPAYSANVDLAPTRQVAKFGPIMIISNTPDPAQTDGIWSMVDKMNNFITITQTGSPIFKNAGNDYSYTRPAYVVPTQSDFVPISLNDAIQDFGLFAADIQYSTTEPFIGPIGVYDTQNPLARKKLILKMKAIKASNPGKIPIFIADAATAMPTGELVMAWDSYSNSIIVNYKGLTSINENGVLFLDLALGNTFAHEIGHAIGIEHAADITNLQYDAAQGGVKWDFEQTVLAAAHTSSEGLIPPEFGVWNKGLSQFNLCSNRMLSRGYINHTAPELYEEAEDTAAGKWIPSKSTTVEISDWVEMINGTKYEWNKFCPIVSTIDLSSGQENAVDPPIAVPDNFEEMFQLFEDFVNNQNKAPIIRMAIQPQYENKNLEIYACGCYTLCQVLAAAASNPTDETAVEMFNLYCEGNPNYIMKDIESVKKVAKKGSKSDGESCWAATLHPNRWNPGNPATGEPAEACLDDCKHNNGGATPFCWSDCKCHPTEEVIITPPPEEGSGGGSGGSGSGNPAEAP